MEPIGLMRKDRDQGLQETRAASRCRVDSDTLGEPPRERFSFGGAKMNPYKLKAITEFLREEGGRLSTTHDQLLRCFSLDQLLPLDEQESVKRELAAIAEAEMFMDRLRLSAERWQ